MNPTGDWGRLADMSILNQFLEWAVPAAGAVLAATVVNVVHRAAGWFKHKTGINVDARVDGVLDDAIAYGYEAARNFRKKHQAEMENAVIHSKAVEHAIARFKALGLPKFAVDLVGQMIEGRLNELRNRKPDPAATATPRPLAPAPLAA